MLGITEYVLSRQICVGGLLLLEHEIRRTFHKQPGRGKVDMPHVSLALMLALADNKRSQMSNRFVCMALCRRVVSLIEQGIRNIKQGNTRRIRSGQLCTYSHNTYILPERMWTQLGSANK